MTFMIQLLRIEHMNKLRKNFWYLANISKANIDSKKREKILITTQSRTQDHKIFFWKSVCQQGNTRYVRDKGCSACYDLPLLIQMFLRNLVGMLTRKFSPCAVTASCRLLPRLAMTCEVKVDKVRSMQCHAESQVWCERWARPPHSVTFTICWFSVGVTKSPSTSLTTCLRFVACDIINKVQLLPPAEDRHRHR